MDSLADPLKKHVDDTVASDPEELKHFEIAETHKTRRFIYHKDAKSLPLLQTAAAIHAFTRLRIAVKGIAGALQQDLIRFMESLCEVSASPPRGIALWGPPGYVHVIPSFTNYLIPYNIADFGIFM
jgi:hypothetical protein